MKDFKDVHRAELALERGTPIGPLESESYLDLFENWLVNRARPDSGAEPTLLRLAKRLQLNHGDSWLSEFLTSRSSAKADALLAAAIHENIVGMKESALKKASQAQRLYELMGNDAGALRSQLESLYSLRRQLQGKECQNRFSSLASTLERHRYIWIKTRILIEVSGCIAMTNGFDVAGQMVKEAAAKAHSARYPVLELRALGYLASFHTVEGRLLQSWQTNETGLSAFWKGTFPRDRAYQFYADLEFAAEKAEQWHLAAALQLEAIEEFKDSQRVDFIASAHCRLARMEEMTRNIEQTKKELLLSQQLFQELNSGSESTMNQADCEVAWGSLEARYGSLEAAVQHLNNAKKIVEHANGFTIRLRYEKAWADLEKRREYWQPEKEHLERAITIANQGFQTLQSPRDRWEWRRAVGEVYHQLLELEIGRPHTMEQTLADWESFRSIELPGPVLHADPTTRSSLTQKMVLSRLKGLHHGTMIAFAVFPTWVSAWVANDKGLHEHRIVVNSEVLRQNVKSFYQLCSDPLSRIEKVNDAGLRLYQLLVAPIEQELDPARTLFIEADEALGMLPWPALLRRDGRYFGHVYTLVNTPGLLYENPARGRRHIMDRILVAYPGAVELDHTLYQPLPQAKEEADFVAGLALYHKYLQGTDVSVRNLLAELPKASSFLFAGHATTRAYSGELVIHGHNGGDVFSASRLAGMNLSGMKLVVLSACSTAREPEAANDPNGLVKAFLNAGAERVIATQWDVNSGSTADLVRDLFMGLSKNPDGEPVLLEIWKNAAARSSHPYYWAAFQVYGSAE